MSDDLIQRQIARRMAYQTTQIGRLEDDLLRVMGERNTALERIEELEAELSEGTALVLRAQVKAQAERIAELEAEREEEQAMNCHACGQWPGPRR